MHNFYEKNLAIISSRWPLLANSLVKVNSNRHKIEAVTRGEELQTLKIDNIHLTSVYDRVREAHLQLQNLPVNPEHIHIYGFALGDLLRAALSEYSSKITVHILNLSVLAEAFSWLGFTDLLVLERVQLNYAGKDITAIMPFVVSPACLQIADDSCIRVRDDLQIRLASGYISERYNEHRDLWIKQIKDNYINITHDHDVSELYNTQQGRRAVIVAAGPSLATVYRNIRELQQQGVIVIAVDAVLTPLLMHGIEPDYMVTVEGQRDLLLHYFTSSALDSLKRCSMVYFPVVHRDIIELWPGKRYCAYSNHEIYKQASDDIPRGNLFISGSVVHPAVDLAVMLGCNEIFFAGLDFGYPGNRSHVSGSYYEQKIEPLGHEKKILNGRGENILSIQNLIVYLRDLEQYLRLQSGIKFFNLSRDGARIDGACYLDE